MGLIGGFVGLIFDMLGYTLGDYENFKFTTALISEIYQTTDKSRMRDDGGPDDTSTALKDIDKCLDTSGRYKYNYNEYYCTWVMTCLCCCCKRKKCYKQRNRRYNRHETAQE